MAQSLEITLESHVKTFLEGFFVNGIVCMMMSTLVGECKINTQCERNVTSLNIHPASAMLRQ